MPIRTVEEYRRAVAEMKRLEGAREGTAADERRQVLRAEMADFELSFPDAECNKGRPARTKKGR